MPLLAIDVGAGTQDILLYRESIPLEGSAKMILPSPTIIVARRIDEARTRGKDVFLEGPTMGGGSLTEAVMRHLGAGLKVFASYSAAATINDDLDKVANMGVSIQEEMPLGAQKISTGDLDLPALKCAFKLFDLDLPNHVAVAVQDHGFSPKRSNRIVRFEHMAEAIRSGGRIESFAFREPPLAMTRMQAVKDYVARMGHTALLMDTGPAAIFGAAADPHFIDPGLIMNFGNGHTVAAIVSQEKITAFFEHHTTLLSPRKIERFVAELCRGTLKNSQVFEDGGHGAFIHSVPDQVKSTVVTGPRRQEFLNSGELEGAVAAAPGGDMMIAGCIGLLEAWSRMDKQWR
jgi:uncharacterized protein (DUF1786 family)